MLPIVLALAVVVVLAIGALGTGIIKLPGATGPTGTGPAPGSAGVPSLPSDPVDSPPPIDNLATPVTGALTLGGTSPVKTIQVGADGASTTVAAPGKPWDGLTINVPAGAWPGSTLQITAQPITGSSFGDLVTPISPLYTVSGAEGLAALPVTLKIPAIIPDDSFAMGFFYDDSGHLEGMPLLAQDASSVTVATQHFSSMFASLVKRSLLPAKTDSGFRPGKDDWQFPNMGSYIGPGGQCTGQVLTEAWYYIERRMKAKAAPLYGLFDNNGGEATPTLWQDDSDGYRLANVAQKQYLDRYNAGLSPLAEFFVGWRASGFDALQYDAFRYAIAVTAEPQIMQIWDAQGNFGHALLAYRVTPGEIFVADPNFPAAWRRVPFDAATGKLGTYLSALNRKEIESGNPTTYTEFIYTAKTALVDWPTLTADWAAFDAGTIGDGLFPAYALEVLSSTQDADGKYIWIPLVDGFRTSRGPRLFLRLRDPQGRDGVGMNIYLGTSPTPGISEVSQLQLMLSRYGVNPIGFYVYGEKRGQAFAYVDFLRFDVILEQAADETASPAAAGRWTLTATTAAGGRNATSYSKPGEKMTVESSSGRIAVSYNYDGPPHNNYVSSSTWTPPPTTAAPGDTWTATLAVQGTCSFDSANSQGWAVSMQWIALWTADAQKMNKMSESAGVGCPGGSESVQTSWTFPAHDEFSGDTLEIMVSGGDSNGSDAWTYHYQWQP